MNKISMIALGTALSVAGTSSAQHKINNAKTDTHEILTTTSDNKDTHNGSEHYGHNVAFSPNDVNAVIFETENIIKTAVELSPNSIQETITLEHIQNINDKIGLSAELKGISEESFHESQDDPETFHCILDAKLGAYIRQRLGDHPNLEIVGFTNALFSTEEQQKLLIEGGLGIHNRSPKSFSGLETSIKNNHEVGGKAFANFAVSDNIALGGTVSYRHPPEFSSHTITNDVSLMASLKLSKKVDLWLQAIGGYNNHGSHGSVGIYYHPQWFKK